MSFTLHPQLAADAIPAMDLKLCRVLLMDNAIFPWLILVPMRDGLRELYDLSPEDYQQATKEIHDVTRGLQAMTQAHKMNVAALGNITPQLHIHVIARFEGDAAWPNPVWNSGVQPERYTAAQKDEFIALLQKHVTK